MFVRTARLRYVRHVIVSETRRAAIRKRIRYTVGEGAFAFARACYWSLKLRWVEYEPETRILPDLVRKGDCCLDAGGNFGQFASFLSHAVGPNGTVFSFEPLPYNQQIFRRVMALLGRRNVELVPMAVADREGPLTILIPESNTAEAYVSPGPGESVEATTIDRFVQRRRLPRVSLLKIDVEGFEREVLLGALRTIREHRPAIICEITHYASERRGVDPLATFLMIQNEGYSAFIVSDQQLVPVEGMVDHINYVFLPHETQVPDRLRRRPRTR